MLVGRENEVAAIEHLLAAARNGSSGTLVLRGEAGIGKSALLEQAVELAAGMEVLRAVGVESESEFPYAALYQLLRPVLDRIERLPDPQAVALGSALALSSDRVDDRFRVAVAVLSLLAEVAEEQPVLCILDDAQWLDQASADALLFVCRRIHAERLAMILAIRDGQRPFPTPHLTELRVESLSGHEARALAATQLGSSVAATAIEWLVANASGNPLALVELPGTLTTRQLAGEEPLPVTPATTTSVEQIYLDRIGQLPAATRRLLVLAATELTGERSVVERAARMLELDIADLAAAEAEKLVHVRPERIDFPHPLVRSAVYHACSFTEREDAHRALASACDADSEPDRAAWHRAAATVGTDEVVADELERTAGRAALRSGHAAASVALERAAHLTAQPEAQARRLVAAADAAWRAGQPERSTAILTRTRPLIADDILLGEAMRIEGEIHFRCGDLRDAAQSLLAGAAALGTQDPRRALAMLFDAANAGVDAADYSRVAEAGRLARMLTESGSADDRALAELLDALGKLMTGAEVADVERISAVVSRVEVLDDPRWSVWAAIGAGGIGDSARETELLRRATALARASSAVDSLTLVLIAVAVEGVVAGRRNSAGDAAEGLSLAREAGLQNAVSIYSAVLAWFAAVQGREEECRTLAAEAKTVATAHGHALANTLAGWALGLLELTLGRPDEGAVLLDTLRSGGSGTPHPYIAINALPDLVEASVRSDRRGLANEAAASFGEFAHAAAPGWLRALAARCRGLLSEGSDAAAEFEEALRLHKEGTRLFDQARTELLYGEHLRRERRRSDARPHLRAALEFFEQLGAAPWADRASAELRASGETTRKRDPGTLDQLTPQELQIARLVGEGASNKDVAAQLFLSPRTVEYHLRKVFMKLGIASRGELIRLGMDAELAPVS